LLGSKGGQHLRKGFGWIASNEARKRVQKNWKKKKKERRNRKGTKNGSAKVGGRTLKLRKLSVGMGAVKGGMRD